MMNIARIGNKYLADSEPWKQIKDNPDRTKTILFISIQIVSALAWMKTNKDNELNGFQEKPEIDYEVSMGIYMANKKILKYIPDGFFGFDDLMKLFLKINEKVYVDNFKGYWLDIGRPSDYQKAIEDFDQISNDLF